LQKKEENFKEFVKTAEVERMAMRERIDDQKEKILVIKSLDILN
jgi:hypothetical protein